MEILELLSLACIVGISQVAPCRDGQHCSDCSNISGQCLTQCDHGYFGLMCKSVCSKTCKGKICHSSATGIGVCSEGCASGYQGGRCLIPCDSPGGGCTECPGGCDGEYCYLDAVSCVSGCSDGHYGSDCKTCSDRCKTCNRTSGACWECHPPYFGRNCEYSCDRCIKPCNFRCFHGCLPGFYGPFCSKNCSENCRVNHISLTKTAASSECQEKSGECTYGCKDGWVGLQCSNQYGANAVTIGLSTGSALLFLMLMAVSYRFRNFVRCDRMNKYDLSAAFPLPDSVEEHKDAPAVEYHGYCEILEDDDNRSHQPIMNPEEGSDSPMPVLADCFPAAGHGGGGRGGAGPGPSNTRQVRDVCVDDTNTVVNYISPVE
ncbi:cell death abnormality protein 1-like [Haliotis rubra]|uniref:cell death abnormality protein 1-like n=1 Tax=Haliotis rubra TaxID=36100 RepID=UPI001EE579C2|nr:cell death abnormality protein 1-like [Haliotis rubra]